MRTRTYVEPRVEDVPEAGFNLLRRSEQKMSRSRHPSTDPSSSTTAVADDEGIYAPIAPGYSPKIKSKSESRDTRAGRHSDIDHKSASRGRRRDLSVDTQRLRDQLTGTSKHRTDTPLPSLRSGLLFQDRSREAHRVRFTPSTTGGSREIYPQQSPVQPRPVPHHRQQPAAPHSSPQQPTPLLQQPAPTPQLQQPAPPPQQPLPPSPGPPPSLRPAPAVTAPNPAYYHPADPPMGPQAQAYGQAAIPPLPPYHLQYNQAAKPPLQSNGWNSYQAVKPSPQPYDRTQTSLYPPLRHEPNDRVAPMYRSTPQQVDAAQPFTHQPPIPTPQYPVGVNHLQHMQRPSHHPRSHNSPPFRDSDGWYKCYREGELLFWNASPAYKCMPSQNRPPPDNNHAVERADRCRDCAEIGKMQDSERYQAEVSRHAYEHRRPPWYYEDTMRAMRDTSPNRDHFRPPTPGLTHGRSRTTSSSPSNSTQSRRGSFNVHTKGPFKVKVTEYDFDAPEGQDLGVKFGGYHRGRRERSPDVDDNDVDQRWRSSTANTGAWRTGDAVH